MSDHGHCHHEHDHSDDQEDFSAKFSLYLKIDSDNVECLNEATEGSGKVVFKPWDERLDRTKFIESDCDAELLLKIPFTCVVKLKSIAFLGGENDLQPKRLRLFKNNPHMTFDEVEKTPDQEFELPANMSDDVVQFPLKSTKFSNTTNLAIHIPDSYGGEISKVYFVGLAGEFMQEIRNEILVTNYELRANPADHKTKLFDSNSHMIS